MHAAVIVAIQSVVHADLAKGEVIDVDAYCRKFGALYPQLTRKQVQDAVLEMISIHGGGAMWGADRQAGT